MISMSEARAAHLCTIHEAEVAQDLTADRLKALLLPRVCVPCDGIAALQAIITLCRWPAQQVQHKDATFRGVQRCPCAPGLRSRQG